MKIRLQYGQLSNTDILNENASHGLTIKPFNEECLKGASYDITPTVIAMSTKTGMLEKVYEDKKYPYRYYIFVKAKDTVLIVSNEYIVVPKNIAGYVVSRVSKVSEGFGHISTSIDPNWKGALLIGLSNPSSKPIKVFVGNNSGEKDNTLATLSFHYLNSACTNESKAYAGMRIDLLEKMKYSNRTGFKAFLRRSFFTHRRNLTDFFFEYYDQVKPNIDNWDDIVKELQGAKNSVDGIGLGNSTKRKRKDHISDYIIIENWWLQLLHWLQKNWSSIWKVFAIVFTALVAFNILPKEWQNAINEFFSAFNNIK